MTTAVANPDSLNLRSYVIYSVVFHALLTMPFLSARAATLLCQPAIPKLPAARQAWPSAVKVEEILVLVIPGTWTLSVTGFAKAGIKTPLILPCGRHTGPTQ